MGPVRDTNLFLHATIDAHSDCPNFVLTCRKSASFISYRNNRQQHWMLLVEDKCLFHPKKCLEIDIRHVGHLQLCSGCDITLFLWRYCVGNKKGLTILAIMSHRTTAVDIAQNHNDTPNSH